ncbi:MAG TPA: hypothetical protein VF781_13840 [Solirubrobacteraceae bacterium]
MKRCLSSILLLVLVLAVPAAATATTFGAQVGGVFINQSRHIWSPAQVMSSLTSLYAAGGRVGRADSDWAGAEPRPPARGHHTYQWGYDDTLVGQMAQAGLRWEPTLQFAPRWAQAHRSNVLHLKTGRFVVPLPPARNADFAAYATAFMRRYGAHGSFWATHPSLPYLPVSTVEVWNEPDNTHNWGPQINLRDYANLYEAVRSAVHRVNRGARVLTGGLAWTRSSLPRLLKAFRGMPLDAVAIHPYAATPTGTIAVTRYALAEMRRQGRGATPTVVNEFGWTSVRGTWGSTSAGHVKPFVYQALVGLSKLRLAAILPFEWASPSWGLNDGPFAQAVARITHHR